VIDETPGSTVWWARLVDELRRERDEARADLKQALFNLAEAQSWRHEQRMAEAQAMLEAACRTPGFNGLEP
jgi:hypothetical protein